MNSKLNILCIGGGISGLVFALKAAKYAHVHLIVKDTLYDSNSYQAKGGIAAPFADNDSVEAHIKDTLIAGEGLCNENAVQYMIHHAKKCINELQNFGINFSTDGNNILDLSREGGHRHNRIVHTKDETGKQVIETLVDIVRKHPNIYIHENHFALDLIIQNGTCCGATILNEIENICYDYYADFVVLATGGAGHIYALNTNPKTATGDGYGLAYRASAEFSNMEFVQFHPTMLYLEHREENILISEALRGAGAILKKTNANLFMHHYHPMESLAPRDIVTRSMITEMQNEHTDFLYLDATYIKKEKLENEFPYIYHTCKIYGIDISKQMIPVVPAAHYICGGVTTNLNGETSIANLYAIGEVACTGVHGANRLASNSLLEGLVFADAAASYIKESKTIPCHFSGKCIYNFSKSTKSKPCVSFHIKSLQELMWENVGIVRNSDNLIKAQNILKKWEGELLNTENISASSNKTYYELLNMIQTSMLITEAAIQRTTSVGTHYREDHQEKNARHLKKLENATLRSVL